MTEFVPAWVGGHLTPVEKIEAHRLGLRHKAVSVFVLSGNAVLLQRRALTKYHTPGLWANTCCTHPRWDEATLDCAVRRLDEELGIRGLAPVLRGQVEYRAAVGSGLTEHEVVDVFVAEAPRGMSLMPNPAEVADVRWAPIDGLAAEVEAAPALYTPWLRIYLERHAARIFGTSLAVAS